MKAVCHSSSSVVEVSVTSSSTTLSSGSRSSSSSRSQGSLVGVGNTGREWSRPQTSASRNVNVSSALVRGVWCTWVQGRDF